MSIHDGHRERMKDRFRKNGIASLQEHEVLEMLLYYCIPRRDTNEIAHALLKEFKTLPRVLNASARELERVDGIGKNAALFITFIRQLELYFPNDDVDPDDILWSLNRCHKYLRRCFVGKKNETVMLLCLDAKCKLLGCYVIGEGSLHSANASMRKIVEAAIAANATSVVLAHNHPGGLAVPSGEDVSTTQQIAEMLDKMDVKLIDHVVIAGDEIISMVDSGLYKPDINM